MILSIQLDQFFENPKNAVSLIVKVPIIRTGHCLGPSCPGYPQHVQPGSFHFGVKVHGLFTSHSEFFDSGEFVILAHCRLDTGSPAVAVFERFSFLSRSVNCKSILLCVVASVVLLFPYL
jgi:hypothetical protein